MVLLLAVVVEAVEYCVFADEPQFGMGLCECRPDMADSGLAPEHVDQGDACLHA